jgi:hypothetical protein
MEIIVPAAGLSTRFPNMRPKYSLTDYSGSIMLKSALKSYIGKYNITIGILQEHDEKFKIKDLLNHEFDGKLNIVVLPKPTLGPADTIYQILKAQPHLLNTEILIKDCDSFFDHEYQKGNYICVTQFADNKIIRTPSAKSFIISNSNGIIQNIVEKEIISDKFCVGGYKFENANDFYEAFENLSHNNQEIYVSNIIQYCLYNNKIFIENMVKNYIDVGTSEEWFAYNNKSSIFCDIDGIIIKAQPRNAYKESPTPLSNNIKKLKELMNVGNEIIFVTSRSEKYRIETQNMLNDFGFETCKLIMGLQNSKRIVINDFNSANPYPRAVAITIPRDSDTLESFVL